jgi:hypothetical protein
MNLVGAWKADELAINRQGLLAPRQRATVMRRAGLLAGLWMLGVVAMIVVLTWPTAVWWIYEQTKLDPRLAMLIALGVAVLAAFLAWRQLRELLDARGGRVLQISGWLSSKYVKTSRSGYMIYKVADHEVKLFGDVTDLLAKQVSAYLLPRSKVVVAIEKIG